MIQQKVKRNYFIGFILSFICPGLGHMYSGKLKLGLIIYLIVLIISLSIGILINSGTSFLLVVGILILITNATCIHCLLTIKKNRTISLSSYNKWYFYVLPLILNIILNNAFPKKYETFHVPAISMAPTIQAGDYVYAEYNFKIQRGDIIIFKYPNDPSVKFIKRIIAIPGDSIEIINKVVFVNDKPITTRPLKIDNLNKIIDKSFHDKTFELFESDTFNSKHRILIDQNSSSLKDFPKTTVPQNSYFVLGDNRDFSSDSRIWGFVPKENIIAKANFIILTTNKNKISERFNLKLE